MYSTAPQKCNANGAAVISDCHQLRYGLQRRPFTCPADVTSALETSDVRSSPSRGLRASPTIKHLFMPLLPVDTGGVLIP